MIKRLITEVENQIYKALFNYIDTQIDELKDRVIKLEDTDRQVTQDLSKVKTVIDSDTETRKTIKKTAVSTIVTGIIGFILYKLGLKI
ncbi:hypothetical protein [Staphylococcus felis]|uniref:Uncharacterized protein n=1 Tax=Staphylococcus felis TaxID=46127 RepID=A0ABS0QLP5_9STAP|nr:hypothetical protein [Staphylococcus felis]AVP37412.1 hypothetical protein C7J90_10765 [Staphylococcus felis]MBH9580139.1 hypothetical protein [Staphylococcus felis]PNZ37090.1 hypothetical protein CD143_02500 [Staphylococcus felis]QQB02640.1 hypothetical protein I6H71_07740 [Staphylococcus felis]REI09547.1 hypothetical protein DOS69_02065 [Staphylococcus felis]